MKSKAGALLAVAIIFSGCVLPPKSEPELKVLEPLGLGETVAPAATTPWWREFGDAQFDGLIEAALASNPSLQEALARVRVAQARHLGAVGGRLPRFDLQSQVRREQFPEYYIYPRPYGGGTFWQGSLLANLSWDIDFWGRQAELIKSAEADTREQTLNAAAARLAIASSLAQTYLDLNRAYALADIAKQAEEQRRQILSITRRRIDAGLDTKVELREAEAAVPQAELARLQAEASTEIALHRLAAITGKGADQYGTLTRPTLNVSTALTLPTQLPADLIGRRPDILAARARIDRTTAERAAARADFFPNVNLAAFVGFQSIGLDNLLKSETFGAGPAVSLPIFDSIRRKSEFYAATAEADIAVAGYNDTLLRAIQEVADQLTYVRSTAQQLERAQTMLSAAEEAYRLAQKRYQAGLANYLSVLTTETQVLDARTTYVDLLHAQALARITLLIAVGGDFDPTA